jgi:hypothetical protein
MDPILPEEASELTTVAERFVQAVRDYLMNAQYLPKN